MAKNNLLGGLLDGFFDLFTGRKSGSSNLGDVLSELGDKSWASNALAGATGSRLTDAQREANAFTAAREDIAWQRELQMANTAHSREMSDLRSAGINPLMTASGGSGLAVPSVSSTGSVSPSGHSLNLGSLLSLFASFGKLPAEIANLKADTKNKKASAAKSAADAAKAAADAAKAQEETRGAKLQNDFFERMQGVREESEKLDNDLKISEKRSLNKGIEKMDSEITKNIEEAKSEEERRSLMVQQAILANAEADNIVAMRPFIQAEMSAKTSLEREQTKVAAIDEAYRRRLIDSGSIEAAVRATKAQASKDEIDAEVKEAERWLKDYDVHRKSGDLQSWLTGSEQNLGNEMVDSLYGAISAISASIKGK